MIVFRVNYCSLYDYIDVFTNQTSNYTPKTDVMKVNHQLVKSKPV